jgi:hypothetical protein
VNLPYRTTTFATSILRFPPRRLAAVFLLETEDGWLVLAREHGWLHGDHAAALRDASEVAAGYGVRVRSS